MTDRTSRRSFLKHSAVAVAATALPVRTDAPEILVRRGVEPCVIGSANAHAQCTPTAMRLLLEGKPPVEAVVAGINHVEDDPSDHSVGLGGLPNELGIVELDASVMDGATGLSGAVASIQNIKNPSRVAKLVMETTSHALLVGAGALAFAKANGFKEEDLLTDEARQIWLYWKQSHSAKDFWLTPNNDAVPEHVKKFFGITGTVHCSALTAKGDLGGCTSTSGMAFKIPGRVGDSPIIGAGLFVDNAAGAAGSTGRGESNIVTNATHLIVEALRQGQHPKDACLLACKRVVEFTRAKYLLADSGRPNFDLNYYCVDKQGRTGGASLYPGGKFSVVDAKGHRLEDCASLFEKR